MTGSVLILTAGMGAGHDRVAAELRRRLERRSVPAEVIDIWDLLPWRIGAAITSSYRTVIRRAPWVYRGVYAVWLAPGGRSNRRASPLIRLAGDRLATRMDRHRPAAAVSTFHLSSQVLGDLRRRGLSTIPTASVVVDFAAHGFWVDPDVDVHFCLHAEQAARLEAMGAPRTVVTGPVVAERFRAGPEPADRRRAARRRLGLAPADRVVLVAAGSWGTGAVERTARTLGDDGRFRVVVLAGRNARLAGRLRKVAGVDVLEWVDDVAELMIASDVLVENAGGLMAMEAMAVGTPVVTYGAIPGHGQANVEHMAHAGVSAHARSEPELRDLLDRASQPDGRLRRALTAAASSMFVGDPADHLAGMVAGRDRPEPAAPITGPAPLPEKPAPLVEKADGCAPA